MHNCYTGTVADSQLFEKNNGNNSMKIQTKKWKKKIHETISNANIQNK